MKKITLLMTLLMLSFSIYGQTYIDEGFEGATFPPTGWADQAGSGDTNNYPWAAQGAFAATGKDFEPIGTKSAFYNELFNISHGESSSSPVAKDKWLITPSINLTTATNPELSYYETMRFPDFAATTGVFYSIDYSGDPNTATWVPINTAFGFSSGEQFIWKQRGVFDLSAANGNANVYIGFRYEGTDNSEWMLDNILVRESVACVAPSVVADISNITATGADFSWTQGAGGTETSWDVELVDLTAGQTHEGTGPATPTVVTTSSNPYSFTSLTTGNSYDVYVRANCGGSTSDWVGPFNFTTAMGNDDCGGAVVIEQDIEKATYNDATTHAGTILGATHGDAVAANGDGGTCSTSIFDVAHLDVWYAFEAKTDAVTISLDAEFDAVLVLYEGTCGNLTQKDCSDDATPGAPITEQISVTGMEAGTTYYVRVHSFDSSVPTDSSFTLKIWSSESLSTEKAEINEFRLYPNPVSDNLNVKAQNTIENISVYNMLGQEVMRQMPNKMDAKVDMTALQTGTYFVKVTINGTTETKRIIKR